MVRGFPLEDGTEFFRHRNPSLGIAFPKSNEDLEFAFDIAFNEPGIVQGEAVPELLNQLFGLVTVVTEALGSFV